MKKILAIALCLTMLVSLFSVAAFAAEEAPSGWAPYGNQEIVYNDALADVIEFDGDLSDWGPSGENVPATDLNYYNMYMWDGSLKAAGEDLPNDFAITTYFAADSEYLYIAFNIMDDTYKPVETGDTEGTYEGFDSFQISLDFMNAFANCIDNDLGGYTRAVWYSFAAREDGKMAITVDGRDPTQGGQMGDDPVVVWADNNAADASIKGACSDTDGGWQAEFAISWDRLYYDAMQKLAFWEDSYEIDMSEDIELGALVAYLNHDNAEEVEETLIFAAGTSKLYDIGSFGDTDGFRPQNHGIQLFMAEGSIDIDDSYTPPEIEDDDPFAGDDEEETTSRRPSGPVIGGGDDEDEGDEDVFPTRPVQTTGNEEEITTEADDDEITTEAGDDEEEITTEAGDDEEETTTEEVEVTTTEEEITTEEVEETTTTEAADNDDEEENTTKKPVADDKDDEDDNKDDNKDDEDDDKDNDDDKDVAPAPKGGCGSVVGVGSVAIVAILGLGVSLKKKD